MSGCGEARPHLPHRGGVRAMTEHIISDERLERINRTAYLAGAGGSVVYTQMGADGPAVVRCRDCLSLSEASDGSRYCGQLMRKVPMNGFCHLGVRRDV